MASLFKWSLYTVVFSYKFVCSVSVSIICKIIAVNIRIQDDLYQP